MSTWRRSDRTFGAELLRAGLPVALTWTAIASVRGDWWLLLMLPFTVLVPWWRTRRQPSMPEPRAAPRPEGPAGKGCPPGKA